MKDFKMALLVMLIITTGSYIFGIAIEGNMHYNTWSKHIKDMCMYSYFIVVIGYIVYKTIRR